MKQIFLGANGDNLNAGTNYTVLHGNLPFNGADSNRRNLIPAAGTLRNFRVLISTAPGSGKSWDCTVMINSVATAITLNIADANTTGVDITNSVAVSTGDKISIKFLGNSSPATSANVSWSLEFEPTTANRFVLPGGNPSQNFLTDGTRTYYTLPGSSNSSTSGPNTLNMVVPIACTIKTFSVELSGTPGVGKNYALSIYKNGSEEATSIVTIADSATTGSATGLSISLAAGDLLAVSVISSGTPTARSAYWGIEFQPTTDGESIVCLVPSAAGSTSATNYNFVHANRTSGSSWDATESRVYSVGNPTSFILRSLYVALTVAPGVGKSWIFSNRRNAGAGAMSVTISGNVATTGSDTVNSNTYVDGDTLDLQSVPSGTPSGVPGISMAMYIDPPGLFSDPVTITESVSILIPTLVPSVSDTVTITESRTLQESSNLSASDNVTVTESFSSLVVIQVSVFNAVTVTENVAETIPTLFLSVSDTITLSESFGMTFPFVMTGMLKRYQYKIYSKEGQFVTTWNDVINEPSFTVVINGGFVECSIALARSTFDFGEESDVAFGNEVQIWCFDDDAPDGVKIFAGYISRYDPRNDGPADSVIVYCLGYHTQMKEYLYETASGVTTINWNSTDPGKIAEDIINSMIRMGSRLNWTETTLQKTGITATYSFNTNQCLESMDKVLELSPAGWYWYVDPDRNLNLHPKQELPIHTFTIGKEVFYAEPAKRTENVINRVYFIGGVPTGATDPLFSRYERPVSISQYGLKSVKKNDQRVTLQATMDLLANNILDAQEHIEIRTVIRVKDNAFDKNNGYDIESVKIGETCQIRNYQDAFSSSKWDVMSWDIDYWDFNVRNITETVMQIVEIKYQPTFIELTISSKIPNVSKRVEDLNRQLLDTITNNNPTSPSIGVEV